MQRIAARSQQQDHSRDRLLGQWQIDEIHRLFAGVLIFDGLRHPHNLDRHASAVSQPDVFADGIGASGLQEAADAYLARLRREPQRSFHFGIRCENRAAWDARLDAIRDAADNDPALKGRVALSGVYFPGDPGAFTQRMAQAFVWTDVIASGLLTIGQHIELQWHLN